MHVQRGRLTLLSFALTLIITGCGAGDTGDERDGRETPEAPAATVDESPKLSDLSEEERRFLGLDGAS